MRVFTALVLAALVGGGDVALAGKKEKGKKKAEITAAFNDDERGRVRFYFVEKHGRGKCPPGLAKKHNGCLPPGLAKKRYVVGRPLPRGIVVGVVPAEINVRIGPPPPGCRYAIVDGDLVKLAVGTMLVIDAIAGLVE